MTSSTLVPFTPKQKRRFYEPVVLDKALNKISHEEGSLRSSDVQPTPSTEEQRFHRFTHRLAGACDNDKGGDPVTSIAVLEHEDRFVYVFGCNQVDPSALLAAQQFLYRLLERLSGFDRLKGEASASARNELLSRILVFNLLRTHRYLKDLKAYLPGCLEYCNRQANDRASAVGRALQTLSGAIRDTVFEGQRENEYLESYRGFLQALDAFLTRQVKEFIDERAQKGRVRDGRSYECWSELRHSIDRLCNYDRVVRDLIAAQAEWPELFDEVEVIAIPSSKKDANPLFRKSEVASNIIHRMVSSDDKKKRYRQLAEALQVVGLDERIKGLCESQRFRPIVHAEVLVLEWVMANASRLGLTFFRDFRYIGSSKGACKLCHYYFDAPGQHSRIRTRPSHGNLYTNWRFPDLLDSDGDRGRDRRRDIYNWMLVKIRDDAFETMEQRESTGKRHDSSTHPLMSVRHTDAQTDLGARELPDVDELGEQLERELSLGSSSTIGSVEDSDLDDEDGGTSLT
ncbi:hypothetical protein ACJ41O_001982 [Fusarium nematophilum]